MVSRTPPVEAEMAPRVQLAGTVPRALPVTAPRIQLVTASLVQLKGAVVPRTLPVGAVTVPLNQLVGATVARSQPAEWVSRTGWG